MFDSIAGDYDALNHILSLDVDKIWRKKALKQIVDAPAPVQVLDLACGTGDFSIAIAKALSSATGSHVTGVDLSEGMLAVMREKVAKAGLTEMISIEEGDGENLRFPDNTFDRVTIAFGIRNFEDRPKGLREMLRVLKPGGRLVILERLPPRLCGRLPRQEGVHGHDARGRLPRRNPQSLHPRHLQDVHRREIKGVAFKLLNIKTIRNVLVKNLSPGHFFSP